MSHYGSNYFEGTDYTILDTLTKKRSLNDQVQYEEVIVSPGFLTYALGEFHRSKYKKMKITQQFGAFFELFGQMYFDARNGVKGERNVEVRPKDLSKRLECEIDWRFDDSVAEFKVDPSHLIKSYGLQVAKAAELFDEISKCYNVTLRNPDIHTLDELISKETEYSNNRNIDFINIRLDSEIGHDNKGRAWNLSDLDNKGMKMLLKHDIDYFLRKAARLEKPACS